MDIYRKRSVWNILLAILGALILLVTILYSNYLAQNLKEKEDKIAGIYKKSLEEIVETGLNDNNLNQDIGVLDTIMTAFKLPIILEDETGYLDGYNWGEKQDTNKTFLARKKSEFLATDKEPIEGFGYVKRIYYFNSKLLDYIKYFPYIQILMVTAFILLGFFFLTTSKRAEQNRVWAGMAKETAHQLGTPISAIIAWIEHLKMTTEDQDQLEIIGELQRDVDRLELVADRFSKIGSDPVLVPVNIHDELNDIYHYMKKRASRKIEFNFPSGDLKPIIVKINKHLFDWVIENLIRNALDAMDGQGTISAEVHEEPNFVTIDLSDTGKGIPSSKFNTVFEPGFTTKQRGWGLGLSLAKRIIDNYHNGKIFVKSSKVGEGSTFTIRLPKNG